METTLAAYGFTVYFMDVFFSLLFCAVVPLGTPPAPEDPLLMHAIPTDSCFFVSWSGTAIPNPQSKNMAERFLADPEIQRVQTEFKRRLWKMTNKKIDENNENSEESEKIDFTSEDLAFFQELFAKHPCVFFMKIEPDSLQTMPASGGFVLDIGDGRERIEKFLESLYKKAGDLEIVQGDGYRELCNKEKPEQRMQWGFRDHYFLLTIGKDTIDSVMERMHAETPTAVQAVLKDIPIERHSLVVHLDCHRMLATAKALDAEEQKKLEEMNLDRVRALTLVTGLDQEDSVIHCYTELDDPTATLCHQMFPALQPGDLASIPNDAMLALVVKLNPNYLLPIGLWLEDHSKSSETPSEDKSTESPQGDISKKPDTTTIIVPKTTSEIKPEPKTEAGSETAPETKPETKPEANLEIKLNTPEISPETKPEPTTEARSEATPETKPEANLGIKFGEEAQKEINAQSETKPEETPGGQIGGNIFSSLENAKSTVQTYKLMGSLVGSALKQQVKESVPLANEALQSDPPLSEEECKELLSTLGDVWCLYSSPSEGMLILTGITVTVQVKDHDHLAQWLETFAANHSVDKAVKSAADQEKKDGIWAVRKAQFAEHNIYYMVHGGSGIDGSLSWCLTDKQLVLSFSPQNIKAYLLRDANRPSLASSPTVADLLKTNPSTQVLWYEDSPELLRLTYPLMQSFGSIMAAQNSLSGYGPDPMLLPAESTIAKYMRPATSSFHITPKGLQLTFRHSLPCGNFGGTLGTVFSALLPEDSDKWSPGSEDESSKNKEGDKEKSDQEENTASTETSDASKEKESKPAEVFTFRKKGDCALKLMKDGENEVLEGENKNILKVEVGDKLKAVYTFKISKFFDVPSFMVREELENPTSTVLYYQCYMTFFDKDGNILGSHTTSSFNGVQPKKNTAGICVFGFSPISLPEKLTDQIASYQLVFYESAEEIEEYHRKTKHATTTHGSSTPSTSVPSNSIQPSEALQNAPPFQSKQ